MFWECLGIIFGGFGSDFWEVWGNASLVFGNGSLHAFENNRAAKMITIGRIPESSFAFLFYEHFDRSGTPCFSYWIIATIETCSFPKISDATKTLTVFLVLSLSDAWQNDLKQSSFWNKKHGLLNQKRPTSYQICSMVTKQIILRHLIAGPAECAQRSAAPPQVGAAC